MSEYIICKGHKPSTFKFGIIPIQLDDFLKKQAFKIWGGQNEVWTIKIGEKDIDFYLTKAQMEINNGIEFKKTEFYNIIDELLKNKIKIAMWYDIYCEDLPLCENKHEVLRECYNGIVDISGMCEVYFMMN